MWTVEDSRNGLRAQGLCHPVVERSQWTPVVLPRAHRTGGKDGIQIGGELRFIVEAVCTVSRLHREPRVQGWFTCSSRRSSSFGPFAASLGSGSRSMSGRFWTIKVVPSSVMMWVYLLSAIVIHLRFVPMRDNEFVTTIRMVDVSKLLQCHKEITW